MLSRIFLVDGTPDGVRTVDTSNWTGRGTVCPGSRFPEAKFRPEFERTGVEWNYANPESRPGCSFDAGGILCSLRTRNLTL